MPDRDAQSPMDGIPTSTRGSPPNVRSRSSISSRWLSRFRRRSDRPWVRHRRAHCQAARAHPGGHDHRDRRVRGDAGQGPSLAGNGLRFELGDISRSTATAASTSSSPMPACSGFPIILDCLHQLAAGLRPGGSAGRSGPRQYRPPSHAVAFEVAREAPFVEAHGRRSDRWRTRGLRTGAVRRASRRDRFSPDQHVRLQVYGHRLGLDCRSR